MATVNSSDSQNEFYSTKKNVEQKSNFYFYNIFFLITILFPVAIAGIFNWVIDPLDIFNTPNYLGLNHIKPDKDNNDRLFKAIDVIRIKPQTIIIGSSRTKQGINPEHPAFSNDSEIYNLALNGPNFYEVRRYVEHAIHNQSELKEIILGIDFFMFNASLDNQPTFKESRLEKTHITIDDTVKALFSIDTLNSSKDTITSSKKTPPTLDDYGKNGFMPNRHADNGGNIWRFHQSIKLYFTLHSDYEFSEQYWSDFRKLVELCQQNNIKLHIFISPSHATQWESIYVTERWSVFEKWKRKIVELTPVWDFSGYNSITTENIQERMDNYVDNSHYTPEIGNLIINKMFNYKTHTVPDDFGVLVNHDNIEAHLENIRKQREQWITQNPDEADLVTKTFTKISNANKTK